MTSMEEELVDLLKGLKTFVAEGLSIRAFQKAVNIYVYDAFFEDVANLVKERDYRLVCLCGTTKRTIRPVATKRVKIHSFEVTSNIFGKVVPTEDYSKLRKEIESK